MDIFFKKTDSSLSWFEVIKNATLRSTSQILNCEEIS